MQMRCFLYSERWPRRVLQPVERYSACGRERPQRRREILHFAQDDGAWAQDEDESSSMDAGFAAGGESGAHWGLLRFRVRRMLGYTARPVGGRERAPYCVRHMLRAAVVRGRNAQP